MALFHLSVTQTKRSAGQSAIASAAYRAGERLYSEYYGEYSDYTRKGGVICSDILLPSHAPKEYADRQTLWNAVEKAERGKNAQLAYSFEISLQNEFSLEENIALAREFLFREFVSRGMTVDVSFHEKECEDGGTPNPHFHFLCPIRPMEQDGTWGIKQRREYVLDEEGNRIRDANGKYVFNAVPTTDWGSPETLEHWREAWAEMCNAKFAEKGLDVRIDHRSYERQGVDLLPTIHEGATVRAMEKKGIRTEKGEFNRWIRATNAVMRSLRPSCWKTAGALRWGITPLRPHPMSHGLAMMTRTASGSMNGVTMEMTAPRWNRISQTGCRTISVFIMSGSGRPRLPAFTSIIRPSGLWTSGHSRSRLITSRMKSSITISASRWKMARSWLGAILPIPVSYTHLCALCRAGRWKGGCD